MDFVTILPTRFVPYVYIKNHGTREMVVFEDLRVDTTGSVVFPQQESSGNCCEGEI